MRTFSKLISTAVIGLMLAQPALAQVGPRGPQGHDQQRQRPPQHPGPAQQSGQYYYNGQWVDNNEWQRHNDERDNWARRHGQRRGNDDSSAIVAGIIGFALGAAIVGSQQDAQRARSADSRFDARCARRYRSYDRSSRTYLGRDGARHYCR